MLRSTYEGVDVGSMKVVVDNMPRPELTPLEDASLVRIQIDGYKQRTVNLKRRYDELGFTASEKPKVLASGMYTNSFKVHSTSKKSQLAWRPTGKVVGSVKPQWKPTGRHFALYDNCPLTRIMEPIVEPLELTPSVNSSSKVTMIKGIYGLLRYLIVLRSKTLNRNYTVWSADSNCTDSLFTILLVEILIVFVVSYGTSGLGEQQGILESDTLVLRT
ncbi:hypothetical protein Tco_1021693 [Tanacetum coccineum]